MDPMKKTLFVVTAVIEAGAGLALIFWPSAAVMLLLGSSFDNHAGLTLGRVAGAALLALGVACWLARHNAESRPAAGLIMAMLLYNSATVLFLTIANIGSGLVGIALWPAVVTHAAMAVWCITCMRST
jgi:hypothetical protein